MNLIWFPCTMTWLVPGGRFGASPTLVLAATPTWQRCANSAGSTPNTGRFSTIVIWDTRITADEGEYRNTLIPHGQIHCPGIMIWGDKEI